MVVPAGSSTIPGTILLYGTIITACTVSMVWYLVLVSRDNYAYYDIGLHINNEERMMMDDVKS